MLSTTKNVSQKNNKNKLNQDLIYSIYEYDYASVKQALEDGADPNAMGTLDTDNDPMEQPLIAAINVENLPALKLLLHHGARVNATTLEGGPAFKIAIGRTGYFELIQELLLYGADPNTYHGSSALYGAITALPSFAVIRYSTWSVPGIKEKLLDWYLQRGEFATPDPFQGVPFPEQTVPLKANYSGMLEIISLLLSKGAQPLIPNDSNVTVLDLLTRERGVGRRFESPNYEVQMIGLLPEGFILTMEHTLSNRNCSAPNIKVMVEYDLKEINIKIKNYMNMMNARNMGVDIKTLAEGFNAKIADQVHDKYLETNSHLGARFQEVQQSFQSENVKLQQQIKEVKAVGNFERKDERKNFVLAIKGHSNAEEAYKTFQNKFKAIHISALAASGPFTAVKEGHSSFSMVAHILEVGSDFVDIIPILGKILKWGSNAAKKIDNTKQVNVADNIVALATPKEVEKAFEYVSRKLTELYFTQYERIATEAQAKTKQSPVQRGFLGLKSKVVHARFISPAEQVTAFAMIWMLDEILYNVHNLKEHIKQKGLEAVLLAAITQRKPPEELKQFWNEITQKLGINSIYTLTPSGEVSNETWHPYDFWTLPGVVVKGEKGDFQYFVGNKTDVAKFGWRLGSLEDVQALRLKQVEGPSTIACLNNTSNANSTNSNGTPKPVIFNQTPKKPLPPLPLIPLNASTSPIGVSDPEAQKKRVATPTKQTSVYG